jgi:Ca2+/Na+ antiporter
VATQRYFTATIFIIVLSLLAFYGMTRGQNWLTRKEGLILLVCYAAFVFYEANQL